jgi:dTDP-glucose pyrophosphorylase
VISVMYQTLITAAGDSRGEFISAGFKVPKSLMSVEGEFLINKAIQSYWHPPERLVVALNGEENTEFFLDREVLQIFPDATIVKTSGAVRGALATAVLAAESIDLSKPLVVSAGDSFICGGIENYIGSLMSRNSDAGTVVFISANPRWSYINIGEFGNVLQVTEKSVTGPYATTGCFYFKSAALFFEAAKWVFINNARINGNFYVSTSLNYLISKGMSVNYELIPREAYKSFSKPADFINQVD